MDSQIKKAVIIFSLLITKVSGSTQIRFCFNKQIAAESWWMCVFVWIMLCGKIYNEVKIKSNQGCNNFTWL